jgi:hypothetical protein
MTRSVTEQQWTVAYPNGGGHPARHGWGPIVKGVN